MQSLTGGQMAHVRRHFVFGSGAGFLLHAPREFFFLWIWDVLKKLTPSSQQAIAAEAIHA